jgi:hypothetical protein
MIDWLIELRQNGCLVDLLIAGASAQLAELPFVLSSQRFHCILMINRSI